MQIQMRGLSLGEGTLTKVASDQQFKSELATGYLKELIQKLHENNTRVREKSHEIVIKMTEH